MIRNAKVGTSVLIKPMKNKALHGVIIAVEPGGERLRTVATDEGYHFVTPAEMWASDEDPRAKPTEKLEPGDRVVLYRGVTRTVADVSVVRGSVTSEDALRVSFEEADQMPLRSGLDNLWRLAP